MTNRLLRRPTLIAAVVLSLGLAGCGSSGLSSTALNSAGVNGASVGEAGDRQIVTGAVKRDIARLTAVATPGTEGYKIGPQDVLEISVFKVAELSRKATVAYTGTVNLPLVGEIPAAGKTTRQFEQELTTLLGAKYLQNPQVSVIVTDYNSQRVTLEGAVNKPGVYPLQGETTLLQLVAQAGGLAAVADSDLLVFRTTNNKRAAGRFNLDEIRNGTAKDPKLQAGDVVVVKSSFTKQAFENVTKALPLARFFLLF